MNATKTTRTCAGEYEVQENNPANRLFPKTVSVSKVHYPNDGTYWISAARWDHQLYSDPLPTKRRAVEVARCMIDEA